MGLGYSVYFPIPVLEMELDDDSEDGNDPNEPSVQ
jgi:hypothetical protein